MNARQKLAETLSDRKGLGPSSGGVPAPRPSAGGPSTGKAKVKLRRLRCTGGRHDFLRLQAELRAATKRAKKAEAALARIKAMKGRPAWERERQIRRAQDALRGRLKLIAARKRIEKLEVENEELRKGKTP